VLQAPDDAEEMINPTRPIKQGNLKQQPPSNKKRAFQVVVDDEIELEEGQIRAQMVRSLVLLRCSFAPVPEDDTL
jgi:hypothetical protein